jgi:branched-chain amino acid transport system substrate-binding protein
MKTLFKSSVLALGLAAGMAGVAHAQQGVTDNEIRIGSNGDLSGVFAAFNVGAIKAAEQVFDEVNAAGGVHGRQIRFIVEDHGYQVPRAVQNFNKLVNSDQVFAMILNLGTPHNIAGFPIMEAAQVHNISPLTSARQMIEGDVNFKWTGTSSYYDQVRAGIQYLVEERGATKVCSMYIPSDFGLEVFEATRDEAEALGIEYADETQHRPDEQEFVGAIQRLRDSGCEVVSMGIAVRPIIIAIGTAKRLGWNDVAFIGSSAGMNTVIAKVPEGVTEGYYAAAGWADFENRLDVQEVRDWAESYQAAHGEPVGTAAQLGQAAAHTLVRALEAAGQDLNPDSFREAMHGLEFYDVINDVDVKYGPDDHQGGDLIVISQIQNGVWVEVDRRGVDDAGAAAE